MADTNMEDQTTTYCTNCKRDIPNQNFYMHDLHCHRNVRLCEKCDEPVPMSEMAEHNEEFHALVECRCKEMIEKSNLEKHEKYCSHRTVNCQFCEMDMKYIDLPEHEHACGSRTEKCQDCGEFIMLKNAIVHVCLPAPLDHGFSTYKNVLNDDASSSFVQTGRGDIADSIPEDVLKFLGEEVRSRGAAFNNQDFNQPHNGQYSSRAAARKYNERFANDFQDVNIDEDKGQQATAGKKSSIRSHDSNKRGLVVDGRRIVPKSSRGAQTFDKHRRIKVKNSSETKHRGDQQATAIDVDVLHRTEDNLFDESFQVKKEEDANDATKITVDDETLEIPCEICEVLIPFDNIQAHQESCLLAQQEALRSYQAIPQADTKPQEVVVIDDDQDATVDMIPCEFCRQGFSFDNVLLHQPYCDMNPQKHDTSGNLLQTRTEERVDFWQPRDSSSTSTEHHSSRRLEEFSSEYQTTMRRVDDPWHVTDTSVTESFSSTVRSDEARMDPWDCDRPEDGSEMSSERNDRQTRR
eukprot:gene14248-15734_t